MTSIIWNKKFYHKTKAMPDFFDFVAWLVKNEQFTLVIDDRGFDVVLSHDGWAASATTSNYDGYGDNINTAIGKTYGEALESLVEKLSEAIYEEKI